MHYKSRIYKPLCPSAVGPSQLAIGDYDLRLVAVNPALFFLITRVQNSWCFFSQLEAEIESLSWKVERAESHDRGDIENQTDVTER